MQVSNHSIERTGSTELQLEQPDSALHSIIPRLSGENTGDRSSISHLITNNLLDYGSHLPQSHSDKANRSDTRMATEHSHGVGSSDNSICSSEFSALEVIKALPETALYPVDGCCCVTCKLKLLVSADTPRIQLNEATSFITKGCKVIYKEDTSSLTLLDPFNSSECLERARSSTETPEEKMLSQSKTASNTILSVNKTDAIDMSLNSGEKNDDSTTEDNSTLQSLTVEYLGHPPSTRQAFSVAAPLGVVGCAVPAGEWPSLEPYGM